MVKIFIVEKKNTLSEKVYDFLMELCNEYKKNEISKKKNKDDQIRSLIGNALSHYSIKSVFGIPLKNQKFRYTKNGKPYLLGYDNIHFSISHSEELVACAVCDFPVGIDVQKIYAVSDNLKALLGTKSDSDAIKLWTKKEAQVKKTGGKMPIKNLKDVDVSKTKTFMYKDYYISVSGEF